MKLLFCYLLPLFLIPNFLFAASPYSPSEGILASGHDPALNKYRQMYFYSNGALDPHKLDSLISFLEEHKNILKDSAKLNRKTNLIFDHGYENEKAEKEGLEAQDEEAETIAPLIFALEHTKDLRANYSRFTSNQIHEKVETILLFIAAGYTPYPLTLFSKAWDRAKNIAENFFEFSVDDSYQTQASNLLLNGRFADQASLAAARAKGMDLSLLNPPSSAIWTDNVVEDYDPYKEKYLGKRFFPARDIELPVFHYERMGNGTIKLKTYWLDESDLNKKGKPKKKDVTLRVGHESYDASVVNHLARIIGYPANPTAFRSAVKVDLGETTFEQFIASWRAIHGLEQGSPLTHLERVPGENSVILKNVTLEAYPDKDEYRKMGPFRMGDNGLGNRREYRAMVLYNALIALQDEFEYQSRVDAIKDPARGWLPIFYISDTSSALGLPAMLGNPGTVNEFTWEFTKNYKNKIHLFWLSVFDSRAWKQTTYSDIKWLARRMARISTAQVDGIMATSGFPAPAKVLYAEKIKSRLNRMILDFDLQKEGFVLHPVLSPQRLAEMYPEYINDKGYLKEGAQEFPGNTLPILGRRFTPFQGAIVMGINTLHNRFLALFDPAKYGTGNFAIDLGTTQVSGGISLAASRGVSVNPEIGPGQLRYLLKDKVSISIPIGLVSERITTPVGLYYTYTFEYFHSVSTMREVGTSRFFALLNPFSIYDIRRNLNLGEQLFVTHSVGASIGTSKTKVIDDIQIEAALLGLSISAVKSLYFAKPQENLLEITTDHINSAAIQSGFDIRTYVRLAASIRAQRSNRVYKLYRVDSLNEDPDGKLQLQEAFDTALIDNDFTDLEKQVKPIELTDRAKAKYLSLGFIVWNFGSDIGVNALEANGQKVILAHKTRSWDRSFNRVWNEKTTTGMFDNAFNFVGHFWGEGQHISINLEGTPEENRNSFKELEVNISLSMFDNYCSRREFENDFKEFFSERSGIPNYIRFRMPNELDVYPELQGTMRWQISKTGLRSLLKAVSIPSNIRYLSITRGYDRFLRPGDKFDDVLNHASRLSKALDTPVAGYGLEQQAKDIVHVIDKLLGRRGTHVAHLRRFIRDDDLWMITSISNMLELSHPTFRHQKEGVYWAPEVGKYQGHSYMDRFRRNFLLDPIMH